MASHAGIEQPELLTSWKEIANYLGKGVRTVQRWEQQFDLPVRRPNEKVKGIVHATRHELDLWLQQQWSHRPKDALSPKDARTGKSIGERLDAMRAIIKEHEELRNANRALLSEIRSSVKTLHRECESIALSLTDASKAN